MKKVGFIVLLLTQAAAASRGPDLRCPSRPVEAAVGEDVTLQCHLQASMNMTNVTVEWHHEHLNQTVHLHRGAKDRPSEQGEDFRGRTALFDEGLAEGNLSLKLSSVRPSDTGRYRCSFSTEEGEASCSTDLTVGGYTEGVTGQTTDSGQKTPIYIGVSIGVFFIIVIFIGVVFGWRTAGVCLLSCLEIFLECLSEV